eukprot:7238737-Heterocapsa_arctica.AAC.1
MYALKQLTTLQCPGDERRQVPAAREGSRVVYQPAADPVVRLEECAYGGRDAAVYALCVRMTAVVICTIV